MNILVVDDEKEIADLIEIYLKNEGYNVFKYYSSKDILTDLEKTNIDLAVLDVMMPDIDGFSLCSKIREKYTFPIIFVTAKVEDIDKISGLTLGADDYITKPFQPLELMARVKAQLRRYTKYNKKEETDENIIDFRNIEINNNTHEFHLNAELIELTPIEFSILWILCKNRGNVVKTDDLFMEVWKEKYYEKDNNTVMVHIRHLREKMKDNTKNPKYIKTIWGVGYKIEK
ncbi:MAG: VanR-ABDEGLN family response regulator transcription factor [Bacilli bacterium]|nr:VanR-ABDEGLN family response regulator transcription factor [Bacilli bacterium]